MKFELSEKDVKILLSALISYIAANPADREVVRIYRELFKIID